MSAVVNFNGFAYQAVDGKWEKMRSSEGATHRTLMAKFRQEVDHSSGLLSAALEREHTFSFHLMSELAGAVEDHGFNDIGEHLKVASDTARKMPTVTSWLKTTQTAAFSILGIGSVVGVAVCLWKYGSPLSFALSMLCRFVWSCVQRPARASHGGQARVGEFEIQPMPFTKGVKKE